MIVQRYLKFPLLLGGFKFDLRVYVAVTGLVDGKVQAYLFNEGLARFCTMKYKKPRPENYRECYMHLTNYSLNKKSRDFIDEDQVKDMFQPNMCSKRTLTAIYKQLEVEYANKFPNIVAEVKKSIEDTCANTVAILANFIQMQVNPHNPDVEQKAIKGQCFHVFGFDILLDSKRKAWLLEINDHPSMSIICCKNDRQYIDAKGHKCGCQHENCPVSKTDLYVKATLNSDMLRILRLPFEERPATFGTLSRVFPHEQADDVYSTFAKLRKFFLRLSQGKT